MGTIINESGKYEKFLYWGLGLFFLAFLASVPSMYRDQQKKLQQAWQYSGCQMYDDLKATDVPAKCSSYFTDHYKPQQTRVQPPEVVK